MGDINGSAQVSLKKIFCTDLPDVMREMTTLYPAEDVGTWCKQLQEHDAKIEDRAGLVMPINDAVVQFHYKGPARNGVFQVLRDGRVIEWGVGPHEVAHLGNRAGEILYRGMAMYSWLHLLMDQYTTDPVLESAVAYMRCRTWNRSSCDLSRQQLQIAVQLKQLCDAKAELEQAKRDDQNTKEGAARHQHAVAAWNKQREEEASAQADQEYRSQVTIPYEKALGIWRKVDTFIAAAKQRDDNDSDLDVLMGIRNGHYRSCFLGVPSTSTAAQTHLDCANQMLGAFQASESLKAFVMEEGDCSTEALGCGPDSHGTYTSCTLGGYSFGKSSGCYEHERVGHEVGGEGSGGGR